MTPMSQFVVSRFTIVSILTARATQRDRYASCGPAPALPAGDVAERPPAFVGCGARLLDRAAHARHLADEIVEPGLDLLTDTPPVLCEIEPSPDPAGNRSEARSPSIHVTVLPRPPPCNRSVRPSNARATIALISRPGSQRSSDYVDLLGGGEPRRAAGLAAILDLVLLHLAVAASDGRGRGSVRPPACSSWCAAASAGSPSSRFRPASGAAGSRTPWSRWSPCAATRAGR